MRPRAQRASAGRRRAPKWPLGQSAGAYPQPPVVAPAASAWTAGTPPSRLGRKAHNCCLSGGTDGVSPAGPQRSEGRAQRVDTPAGPELLRFDPPRHLCALSAAGQVNTMTLNPEAACAARTPRRPADRRRPYPHSFEESR